MPAPQFVLRDYAGDSTPAQLQSEIGASDLSFNITPTTGWTNASGDPVGTLGPFCISIDRFEDNEEKILCSSIDLASGLVMVYVDGGDGWTGRGYDDSTPTGHIPGGSAQGVQCTWSAVEAAEANAAVFNVLGAGSVGAFGVPIGVMVPWAGPRTTVPTNFKLCDGSAISRSTYAALLAIATVTTTGNVSSTSETISGIPSSAVAEMGVGMKIEGLGIPAGTTVASIPSTTSITISAPATGTHSGTALTAYLWGNGDGTTTFNLPDARGKAPVGANGTGSNGSPTYTAGETGGEQLHTLDNAEVPHGTYLDNGGSGHTHADPGHGHPAYINAHDTWGLLFSPGSSNIAPDGEALTTSPGGVNVAIAYDGAGVGGLGTANFPIQTSTTGIGAQTAGITDENGGGSHNNMPPFFVPNWIVRSN